MTTPTVVWVPNPPGRKLYFNNNEVEALLTLYHWTGCTNVGLRDQVMVHADPLISKVTLIHQLHKMTGDRQIESFLTEAWMQIESSFV